MDYNYAQSKIAGFPIRLAAFYLNLSILLLITYLIVKTLLGGSLDSINIALFLVIFLPLSFFSDIVIQSITGANLGKLLLGLKIVDDSNFENTGIFRNVFRSFFYLFALCTLGIGLLAIPFNSKKKGLHDLLTNTVVVYNPGSKIPHAIHKIFAFIIIPFSFLASILVPLSAAVIIFNSLNILLNHPKSPAIVSKLLEQKPKSTISLPSKDEKVMAQIELKNKMSIAFEINPRSKKSYINSKYLKQIGAGIQDAPFYITQKGKGLELQRSVLIPKLILKNTKSEDLMLNNVNFLVSGSKNLLGADILQLFDYRFSDSSLKLKLFPEEISIIENKDSSLQIKKYLRSTIQKIRVAWEDSTILIPEDVFNEFSSSKKPISNEVEIEIETKFGYVLSGKLLKPSKSEAYNDFCSRFIHNLPRFKNIPEELKSKETFTITYKLQYDGHLDSES